MFLGLFRSTVFTIMLKLDMIPKKMNNRNLPSFGRIIIIKIIYQIGGN